MKDRRHIVVGTDLPDNRSLERAGALADLVNDLPALPQVLVQALAVFDSPDPDFSELLALFSQEPVLSARLLRTANSPAFSRGVQVTRIGVALAMLGLREARNLLVAACVDTFRQQTSRDLPRGAWSLREAVWRHSIYSALAAEQIAGEKALSYADEAFVYGLLHDLGKLALIHVFPGEYLQAHESRGCYGSICDAEAALLGASHPSVGAMVAHKWSFPVDTCEVIRLHHEPLTRPFRNETSEKAALVRAADLIAHHLEGNERENGPGRSDEVRSAAEQCELDDADLDCLLRIVASEFARRVVA
jgi:putative nucleotidyltransferase with HDIG domain